MNGSQQAGGVREWTSEEGIRASEGRNTQDAGENYVVRSFMIFYSSLHIVRVMKSRWMRWAGNVGTHEGGEMRTALRLQSPSERYQFEGLGIDGTNY